MSEKEGLILVRIQSTSLHKSETTRLLNNRRINAGQQKEDDPMRFLMLILTLVSMLPGAALAETTTFVCDYKTYSGEDGLHKVENSFILTFIVDNENGKAYMVGNLGSEEVSIVKNSYGVTFVEVTDVGNVMITTIINTGQTVHSRNSVMFGEIVPSQYYGECLRQ